MSKQPNPPLDLRVLASEVSSGISNKPVYWFKQKFPESFNVAVLLADRNYETTGNVWAVRWQIHFNTHSVSYPVISDLAIHGTWHRRTWVNDRASWPEWLRKMSIVPTDIGKRTEFPEPLIWDALPAAGQIELWQIRYVAENLHVLRRAAFEIAATVFSILDFETFPEGSKWSSDGLPNWDKQGDSKFLNDFGKQFNEWQGRKVLTDDFLDEIATFYLNEVDHPEDGKSPKPMLALERLYGRPRKTIDVWVREASKRGFLPEAEVGKVRKVTIPKDNKVSTSKVGSKKTNKLETEKK